MPRRSFRGSRARSGRRPTRKRVWARDENSVSFGGAAGVIHLDFLAAFEVTYGADLIGSTVGRIRFTSVANRQVGTGLGGYGVGIRVVDGAPTGLTAADGPVTAPHKDWMYWKIFYPQNGDAETSIFGITEDIRSMRRMEELDESLVISIEALDANEWSVRLGSSVLLLLP